MRNNSLFYTCSLIEYMGRIKHRKRADIVNALGYKNISSIYRYADVLHCESIEKICDEYLNMIDLEDGNFDNVAACKYLVPDYWDIGDVYSRLVTDVQNGDMIESIIEVYNSKTSRDIDDYNSALYFQPRDYLHEYYKENK